MLANLFLIIMKIFLQTNYNICLYRYIDDIIIFLANYTKCLFPVKYPSYLNPTKNILTDDFINFLDLKLILNNQQLCIDVCDKLKDFEYKVNTLIHVCICQYAEIFF